MNFIDRAFFWLSDNFRITNSFRSSFLLGQKGAVWIDYAQPYMAYERIPQLKAVVDRKAQMFSNMELKLVNKSTGEQVQDKDFDKLIKNPNTTQSMNDWLVQFKQQEQIYGNQFMYKNKPSGLTKYPVALWNISPAHIKPWLTGKIWDQIEMSGIIEKYECLFQGVNRIFKTEEILYSRIPDLNNPIEGKSPIYALKYPLTNIERAYEYRNVLMENMGALGLLTNTSRDAMGAVPLTPEERKRIEEDYRNSYGVGKGKGKIKISEADLKWQAMSFPTKDMMLFEEIDANTLIIMDTFGMNINIFSNKNATFENVKNAMIQVYQDTIFPEADKFTQALGKFLMIPETLSLVASYDHIAILKENKQKSILTIESLITALNQAVQGQLLSAGQAKIILQNELKLTGSIS